MKLILSTMTAIMMLTSIASAAYVNLGTNRTYIGDTYQSRDGQVFAKTINDTYIGIDPTTGVALGTYENNLWSMENLDNPVFVPAYQILEVAMLLAKFPDAVQGQTERGYAMRILDYISDEVIYEYFAATPTAKYIDKQQTTIYVHTDGTAEIEIRTWRYNQRWHLVGGWKADTLNVTRDDTETFATVGELNHYLGIE